MNKMKSFVKQFVAVVVGDTAEATAIRALRQADNALVSQISALKFETMKFEDALTEAKEREDLATINGGKLIENKEAYVRNLYEAKNSVTTAEEALRVHKEKVAFLEGKLKAISEEVEK